MKLARCVFLALALTGSALHAQAPSRAAVIARVDSIVKATLAADKTPGLTLAVVRGSDTIVMKGYGLADVENNVPVTAESVFRIGSITKQFTSAAVMKLVEDGKIRLDGTLGDYLPEYAGAGKRATMHQLLNHTSGIVPYTGVGPKFWDQSRLDLTHAQMLELFAKDSLQFEPGSRMVYNNSGYYLLGMIIEKVTGKSYAEHLRATEWQPLGLTQTMYCGQREIIPHRAQGYEVANGTVVNAAPLSMNLPFAAGALCSTPRDLVKWTRALHGGRVVSPASFTKMTSITQLSTGMTNPYGYGLVREQFSGHAMISHGGGINGFGAFLAHYPADQLTIALAANGPTNTTQLHQKIMRVVLGIPEPVLIDRPTTAAERARYAGNYDLAPTRPMKIRVFERDGRLFAQAEGQGAFPLRKQQEHVFDAPETTDIRITFTLTEGRVSGFVITQGGVNVPGKRIE
jgi:D-alanyl-D-alanine carboxypeptidase